MSGRSRQTSEEERVLFETTVGGRKTGPAKKKPAPEKKAAKRAAPKFLQTGVDGGTALKLRRGKMEPDARLDLHGLTETQAHRALVTFVRGAHARGLRLLLVVTGKGRPLPQDKPFDLELVTRSRGVLRTLTPRWLAEPELAQFVAKSAAAHRRHGGEGALYIYLRKRRP